MRLEPKNRTSREDGCLDSGHERWPKREGSLSRSDGSKSKEDYSYMVNILATTISFKNFIPGTIWNVDLPFYPSL
jgi:hypothetical protein